MRLLVIIILVAFFLCTTAELMEKRSSMGGSAFGGIDRIPLSYLRKYYRQKTMKRDDNELLDFSPQNSQLGYRSISFWPLY
ncbi:Neuropeptide-Like Protein [Caenorhabditis elegans]|uniref:Neuropeptide-Like Protein n=1 Tax=Caenorhabditis elegans TaxID=6239 RepID=Q95Y81_CAEEL|nr:Neuropeptide-Like Protein [Caenorhabditis elegans]CCD68303.1 Neuropeptide-Like Protein [Caenorhabditis elegans]|eukprot:NP_491383.1 Uncharacterized protein CELE_Y119C1B.6 [Caenorhabditis elegans]